ncbi:MAG: hypothetical protein AAGA48_12380 [Myxococcota bacterium]
MTRLSWMLGLAIGCDVTSTDEFSGGPQTGDDPEPAIDRAPEGTVLPVDTVPIETGELVTTPSFDCVDAWAQGKVSETVTGDTSEHTDRLRPSCRAGQGEDGPEMLIGFTAPAAGTYRFDLVDDPSNVFDTVLVVLESCDGPELACDDDYNGITFQSRVSVTLEAGQTVIAQVDGYGDDDYGPFVLAIDAE